MNQPKNLEEALVQFDEKFSAERYEYDGQKFIDLHVSDEIKSFLTLTWHAAEEAERTRIVGEFLKKATLTDNPIEQGEQEVIDGSFYQIYRGDFEKITDLINKVNGEK